MNIDFLRKEENMGLFLKMDNPIEYEIVLKMVKDVLKEKEFYYQIACFLFEETEVEKLSQLVTEHYLYMMRIHPKYKPIHTITFYGFYDYLKFLFDVYETIQ
jgi:hypothetical protein